MDWEMIIAAIITMLVCGVGAILWVVIPPQETDWKKIVPKWVCALIVGLALFLGGLDPRQFEIPSYEILFVWFIPLISSGYVSIEVLKKMLEPQTLPPKPPEA